VPLYLAFRYRIYPILSVLKRKLSFATGRINVEVLAELAKDYF